MSIIKELESNLKDYIKKTGYDEENIILTESNRKDLGDYQLNDAMKLAKIYHESPVAIANKIMDQLKDCEYLEDLNIAGPGFINFRLSEKYLLDALNRQNESIYENIDMPESKNIVLDYGGPNVAKALHVGHLRSANIGQGLKNLAKTLGYNVISDVHLGDYGRPLGLVILEIKKRYPDLKFFDESYKGDYKEVELPITNKDLEQLYPIASQKSKEDEEYLEEAREITTKMQRHERGYYDIWQRIIEISKNDVKKIYEELNINFELWEGESDAAEFIPELLTKFEQNNLIEESNGAKIVNVKTEEDNSPMPPLLLVKSNDSVSYETTDLAAILERQEKFNPDEIWYCVDNRQKLHFDQVFRAAHLAHLVNNDTKLEFVGFGTMNGKDGKPFKTRDGGVLKLNDLIELVTTETEKRISSNIDSETERMEIARQVAISSLKYTDLLPYRETDYVFEIEKFADMEGKTGPYLLYSTMRMKSLLRKSLTDKYEDSKVLTSNTEKDIVLTLLRLPIILEKSLNNKSLNDIAEYLYKLTSLYNKFYSENKVLTEEDLVKKSSWLTLTKVVYETNTMLLNILGIKVPDKM